MNVASPLSVTMFCRAARAVGFSICIPMVPGPVIAQRGDIRLEASISPSGAVEISGHGSYLALTEMFPPKPAS